MSSQAIGQRFRVSRGGCWQCPPDCRIRWAEVLTFSSVAYNGLRLGVVPHFRNLIINHVTISGITLNRCYVPLNFNK